jgi:hypothetical protein
MIKDNRGREKQKIKERRDTFICFCITGVMVTLLNCWLQGIIL